MIFDLTTFERAAYVGAVCYIRFISPEQSSPMARAFDFRWNLMDTPRACGPKILYGLSS